MFPEAFSSIPSPWLVPNMLREFPASIIPESIEGASTYTRSTEIAANI
jgi:hypothetical protein